MVFFPIEIWRVFEALNFFMPTLYVPSPCTLLQTLVSLPTQIMVQSANHLSVVLCKKIQQIKNP